MRNLQKSLHKIAVDTAALISLVHGGILDLVLSQFKVIVSNVIMEELERVTKFKDSDGRAAKKVLKKKDKLEIQQVTKNELSEFLSTRVNPGEASCIVIAKKKDVKVLISDDFKAMAELEYHSKTHNFKVGLCAALIRTLMLRKKLKKDEARKIFEKIGNRRNWIGRPIYEYGKKLFRSALCFYNPIREFDNQNSKQ